MGNEGMEDEDHIKLKDEHRKHKHHPHKHRKGRFRRNAVNTVNAPNHRHQRGKATGTLTEQSDSYTPPIEAVMLEKKQNSKHYDDTQQFKCTDGGCRKKRSLSGLSQWQNVLDELDHKGGGTDNSDVTKKLEILEELKRQLEREVSSEKALAHGHHTHHPSVDVEAKNEEIQVLNDLEKTLQQANLNTDREEGVHHSTGQDHDHEHGHRHEDPHGHGRLASETESHGQTDLVAKPDLGKLEHMVLQDVANAEKKGLTAKEEVKLEKEVEGLELLEKQSVQDLMKDGGLKTE